MLKFNSETLRQFARWIFPVMIIFLPGIAFSMCKLPNPDVGGEDVSPPNYTGYLEKVEGEIIFVRGKNNRIVRVNISGLAVAYSAFGGDERFGDLKNGIAVRVWYKGCLVRKNPVADYVEYFSNNPFDQPKSNYFSRH